MSHPGPPSRVSRRNNPPPRQIRESQIAFADADTEAPKRRNHARIWSMAARLTAYVVAFIVGVTLIAGLIVGAQREDDGAVDLIIVNAKVYAGDGSSDVQDAVAVRGNKVIRV